MTKSIEELKKEFEDWLWKNYMLTADWNESRNCYVQYPAHLAFQVWLHLSNYKKNPCQWKANQDGFLECFVCGASEQNERKCTYEDHL